MGEDSTTNQTTALAGVALRYPEKTFYLGQAFRDTTNSYKLVWFLAILSLLRRSEARAFAFADIFTEMAATAWHPVCLYRLSLGRQDKLQDVILGMKQMSRLAPDAKSDAVRRFVCGSGEAKARFEYFRRYVPTRFLAPWFAEKLHGTADSLREAQIRDLAKKSQSTPFASPYWFDAESIRLNDSWRAFLVENMAVVQAFAEHHFALYLQARNPNVPGVVNKMRAPTERQLATARQFWRWVRDEFEVSGKAGRFQDIYSERALGANFAIDHFLPWSFVVHDLLWNLTPVEQATNSSKNDVLPDLDLYLPRLAKLHFSAVEAAKRRPKLLEDYTDCFKLDATRLLALGEDGVAAKYREVILPQAQIAANQGFQTGWKFPALIILPESRRRVSIELPTQDRDRTPPSPQTDIVVRFPTESEAEPSSDYLPYYSLAVAAGGFGQGYEPDPEGWVNVGKLGCTRRLGGGFFVTRVVGKSMEPTIRDGAYCVFRAGVTGTRQHRILLVQKREFTDPETGGGYTVKRYESTKETTKDGWRHQSIRLIPDNPDRTAFPVIEFTPEDEADLRVVAEFVQMLTIPD